MHWLLSNNGRLFVKESDGSTSKLLLPSCEKKPVWSNEKKAPLDIDMTTLQKLKKIKSKVGLSSPVSAARYVINKVYDELFPLNGKKLRKGN
jgi:hypothetical protein